MVSASRPVPAAFLARRGRDGRPVPQVWRVYSRPELRAAGWTDRRIAAAIRGGILVRPRRGVYLDAAADAASVEACAAGGRLTCVSELARWGVFVFDAGALHVCNDREDSRHPSPSRGVRRHRSRRRRRPRAHASVDLIDAFVEAVRCQAPRAAVATLDSGLHERLIDEADLDAIFAALPARHRVLRGLLEPRSGSGAETFLRLLLRALGCRFEVQVRIHGVGVVDFVVAGRLIVECDSRAWHGGWEQRRTDLRRDQIAASLGYVTYRPIAEDLFWHPERVVAALRGLLRAVENS